MSAPEDQSQITINTASFVGRPPKQKRRKITDFHGGLHLDDHKSESNALKTLTAKIPKRLIIPLQQHIGEPSDPIVKPGDHVLKGQLISRVHGYIGAPTHASSSGTVVEISEQPVPHPSGLSAPCVVIETDGLDEWAQMPEPLPDYQAVPISELRERIRWAGIVGLGGAAFPTSVKVNTGPHGKIQTLVINGVECEPYITCDDRLMREKPNLVIEGALILMHIIGANECLIGVEDNKPEAIQALTSAITDKHPIEVVSVPTKYPSGGEKQLIYLLTGLEVPSNGLPADVGVLCQNVGTCVAVADAILEGKPLISRYVTVTGDGVQRPGNFQALIGTGAQELIEQAGGYSVQLHKLIMGGPMMGFSLKSDQVPVIKATNCYLAASKEQAPDPMTARSCIRCGFCVDACPVNLLPQQLYWYAKSRDFDKTQDHNLFDCIECGCCAYVCPSHIPLVHYYRYAKTEVWAQEQRRKKSDLARERFDFRNERLERIKAERKAKLREKREVLEQKQSNSSDGKKAAIEAAMKRVAEKKAAKQAAEPGQTK